MADNEAKPLSHSDVVERLESERRADDELVERLQKDRREVAHWGAASVVPPGLEGVAEDPGLSPTPGAAPPPVTDKGPLPEAER